MSNFWTWYAMLPDFSNRHPVLGLIISVAILYAILVCITHPFQVLRLLARLFICGIDGLASASGSISRVKGPLPGPTAQPPIVRWEAKS